MKPSALSLLRTLALIAGSAVFPIGFAAQTLEHRPPEKPAPSPAAAVPALQPAALAAGTALQVEISRNYPMKAGETVEGELVFPLYVNGKLAVPARTPVRGTVTALAPDGKTRVHGRLRGDFTPFHTPEVHFDQLILPTGPVALDSQDATTGAPILHLVAVGVPKKSMVGRYWTMAKTRAHDQIAFFTAPGLGDRCLQMLYSQLPYHPERIPAHTAWTFELAEAAPLPNQAVATDPPPPAPTPGKPEVWHVNALLTAHLTSATAKPGDPVQALVVEPVFDKDNQLVVPQGSILEGRVTIAKPAHLFGRNGKLRFNFQQVRFPEGVNLPAPNRQVEGSLSGATAESAHGLLMDAEGTVTPKNQASAIAPLLLTFLAGRALDEDGSLYANNTVASNGFGLIGRVVGIAAGNRNLAAGLGYYAAALSTYENFVHTGHDVDFPKDTHIEIETTPLRAPVLKPDNK
ncbi:MAG TPA: hypothetical protein VF742_14240 [Terracidiphilus sp.]|jgi:hypothetical protein